MNRTNPKNVWLVIGSMIFAFILLETSYRSYRWLRYDEPFIHLKDSASGMPRVRGAPQYVGHVFLNYLPNPLHPGITSDWFRVTPDVTSPNKHIVALGGWFTFGSASHGAMNSGHSAIFTPPHFSFPISVGRRSPCGFPRAVSSHSGRRPILATCSLPEFIFCYSAPCCGCSAESKADSGCRCGVPRPRAIIGRHGRCCFLWAWAPRNFTCC